MNLKTLSMLIIVLALVVGGLFMFKSRSPQETEAKFINQSQVPSGSIVVKMTPEGFEPTEITINKGEKVVWLNMSGTYAWPASDLHPSHLLYPEFDPLEPIPDGQAWVFAFDKAGEWKFHDHLKPNHRGVVRVN